MVVEQRDRAAHSAVTAILICAKWTGLRALQPGR
jgi:hypothetical protein